MTPRVSSEISWIIVSIPIMRLASSPDWKERKNFTGRFSRRLTRAGLTFVSAEAERRSSATDRTVVSATVVKPATIATWVTVARPFRSSMGIISLNMVSVMTGVIRGISPATKLTRRMLCQSGFQQ